MKIKPVAKLVCSRKGGKGNFWLSATPFDAKSADKKITFLSPGAAKLLDRQAFRQPKSVLT